MPVGQLGEYSSKGIEMSCIINAYQPISLPSVDSVERGILSALGCLRPLGGRAPDKSPQEVPSWFPTLEVGFQKRSV